MARSGALNLDELIDDINVPVLEVPDLDASPAKAKCGDKDLFAEKKRAAWKDVQVDEARCELATPKIGCTRHSPSKLDSALVGTISLAKPYAHHHAKSTLSRRLGRH